MTGGRRGGDRREEGEGDRREERRVTGEEGEPLRDRPAAAGFT